MIPLHSLPPLFLLDWTLLGMKEAGRMSREKGFVGDV